MATINRVTGATNTDTNSGVTTHTISAGTTSPTAGNLGVIVIRVGPVSGNTPPAGWRTAIVQDNLFILYKILESADEANPGWDFTTSSGDDSAWIYAEYSCSEGWPANPLDTSGGASDTSVTQLLATTDSDVYDTTNLVISGIGMRTNISSPSWTNGLTVVDGDEYNASGGYIEAYMAEDFDVTTATPFSSTASWTTSASYAKHAIAVFKITPRFDVNLLTSDATATAASSVNTAFISPSANSTILIGITSRCTSADTDQIFEPQNSNELVWTKIASVNHDPDGTSSWLEIWSAKTDATPQTNFPINMQSTSTSQGRHWHVYEVVDSNLHKNNGVVQTVTANNTSLSISTTTNAPPATTSALLNFNSVQISSATTFTHDSGEGFIEGSHESYVQNESSAVQYKIGNAPSTVDSTWVDSASGGTGAISVEVSAPQTDITFVGAGTDDGHIDGTNLYNTGIFMYFGQWQTDGIQHMYMRFDDVGVPQGMTIESAYLSLFFEQRLSGSDDLDATIYAQDEDDPVAFDSYSGGSQPWTGRSPTTASVAWTLDDGGWTNGTYYSSPDIKTILQEIVDRPGWAAGQAMLLYLEDEGPTPVGNEATFEAYEDTSPYQAYLTINFSSNAEASGTLHGGGGITSSQFANLSQTVRPISTIEAGVWDTGPTTGQNLHSYTSDESDSTYIEDTSV